MSEYAAKPPRIPVPQRIPLFKRVKDPKEIPFLILMATWTLGMIGLIHVVGGVFSSSLFPLVSGAVYFASALFLVRRFGPVSVGVAVVLVILQVGYSLYIDQIQPEPTSPEAAEKEARSDGLIWGLLIPMTYVVLRLIPLARVKLPSDWLRPPPR
jgi:hypothetical protein